MLESTRRMEREWEQAPATPAPCETFGVGAVDTADMLDTHEFETVHAEYTPCISCGADMYDARDSLCDLCVALSRDPMWTSLPQTRLVQTAAMLQDCMTRVPSNPKLIAQAGACFDAAIDRALGDILDRSTLVSSSRERDVWNICHLHRFCRLGGLPADRRPDCAMPTR